MSTCRRNHAGAVSRRRTLALVVAIAVAATLGGCAFAPPQTGKPDEPREDTQDCLALFERDDRRILHGHTRDAQFRTIPGRPFLRTDRFHASLIDRLNGRPARAAWLDRLAGFDRHSRSIEHRNLAPDERPPIATVAALDDCRDRLVRQILDDHEAFESLQATIGVHDNYSQWRRVLGAYPVSARIVLRQVRRLHERERRYFNDAETSRPAAAARRTYGIGERIDQAEAATLVAHAQRDPLGVPIFDDAGRARLFAAHSPVFVVEESSDADRIGRIAFDGKRVSVDESAPAVYTYLTYTRFAGVVLPQFNYTIWFPARADMRAFDPYAGWLDGVTWRVTLDADGSVLIADAMHNCGCYYMAFPGTGLRPRSLDDGLAEPLWIPRTLTDESAGRIAIHLSAGEHYLRGLTRFDDEVTDAILQILPYAALKNLGTDAGPRRNLFDPDGLVGASARPERFILWPMGIASAGAMRVAGHHAIAFVGRRHFDDPDLFDRYFERALSVP